MILIGGGSRSGKSRAALQMMHAAGPRVGFIATAQASDDEMHQRIAHHRAERAPHVTTWEEPFDVAERIRAEDGKYDSIVVDCLTIWLSNCMLAQGRDLDSDCQELVHSAASASTKMILVTNEVGCGIVPDHELGRRFRDHAGRLNQLAAERASEVHWMIFGIGLRIK